MYLATAIQVRYDTMVESGSCVIIGYLSCKLSNSYLPVHLKDEVVARKEERIAAWTFLPPGRMHAWTLQRIYINI
jgi:hypothetical protein